MTPKVSLGMTPKMPPGTMAGHMETRLLTYAELGSALGITAASAKRLSNRRKWAKTVGNDGLSRVFVPVDKLKVERPTPEDDPRDSPRDTPEDDPRDALDDRQGVLSVLGMLTRHVERLETDLAALRNERDLERQQVASLTLKAAQVDVLREVIASEQRRVADLEHRADELRLEREALMRTHRDQIEDLRAERDKLLSQVDAAHRLLTHQTATQPNAHTAIIERRGWWPFRRRA